VSFGRVRQASRSIATNATATTTYATVLMTKGDARPGRATGLGLEDKENKCRFVP